MARGLVGGGCPGERASWEAFGIPSGICKPGSCPQYLQNGVLGLTKDLNQILAGGKDLLQPENISGPESEAPCVASPGRDAPPGHPLAAPTLGSREGTRQTHPGRSPALHGTGSRGGYLGGPGSSRHAVGASGVRSGRAGGWRRGVTGGDSLPQRVGSVRISTCFLQRRRGCKKEKQPQNLPHSCSRVKLLKSRSHSETLPALRLRSRKSPPSAACRRGCSAVPAQPPVPSPVPGGWRMG